MSSNLPQKYNDGIIHKIKTFIFNLLGKRNSKITNTIDNSEQETKKETRIENKNSIELMREENERNREKETLLLKIEKNPDLIDNFPIEKLEKLEKLIDEKIAEYDDEIAKIKKQMGI